MLLGFLTILGESRRCCLLLSEFQNALVVQTHQLAKHIARHCLIWVDALFGSPKNGLLVGLMEAAEMRDRILKRLRQKPSVFAHENVYVSARGASLLGVKGITVFYFNKMAFLFFSFPLEYDEVRIVSCEVEHLAFLHHLPVRDEYPFRHQHPFFPYIPVEEFIQIVDEFQLTLEDAHQLYHVGYKSAVNPAHQVAKLFVALEYALVSSPPSSCPFAFSILAITFPFTILYS